ncbi:cyanophycinase [Ideonella sp. DXS22W]|uniref:Cyanophycinase n=1 Tax=Pseudaquabacterium inlustre TaxID=2984192 RepID=A0ABU9CJG7_9BURK
MHLPTPARRRLLLAFGLLGCLAGCLCTGQAALAQGAAASGPAAAPQGVAVAIGGALRDDNELIWGQLIQLSGGPGAKWVVLGTASDSPQQSADNAAKQLRRRGAVADTLPVSPLLKDRPVADAVRDPALIDKVRAARGVFFTGGAQERIVSSLQPGGQPSPLLQAIWDVYRAGGVVAGTSAGAAIMSGTMFIDAPDVVGAMKGRLREGQEYGRGLGFMGAALFVDQHFLKRGRIGRMLPLMQRTGLRLGLGVEEDSAAALRGEVVTLLGGQAVFADLTEARSDAALGVFNLRGARLSLLDAGDQLNLATRTFTPATRKARGTVYDPAAPNYKPYNTTAGFDVDWLANGVLATRMGQLIDGSFSELRGLAFDPRGKADDPLAALGFEWRLYKAPGSIGWSSPEGGDEDYSVHRLGLDVLPVRMAQPLYGPWPAAPAR